MPAMPRTLQLARIFGIRIGVSTSWFFVLFVMVFWLSSLFRQVLDSDTAAYAVAVGSALAFFASLIFHELGHALAARREGIEIAGIDLWFFGGIARMNREADTPGAELRVALAGSPATGLWTLLLAMILGQAARGAVMQSAVSERLAGVTVADIMDREPVTVSRDTSLLQAEDEYFMRYRWPWFAVVDAGGRFLGILRRERVEQEIADGRPALAAGEAVELDGNWQIRTDATLQALLGSEALRRLGGVAAVDADGVLRGVVTVTDVRRALTPLMGGT